MRKTTLAACSAAAALWASAGNAQEAAAPGATAAAEQPVAAEAVSTTSVAPVAAATPNAAPAAAAVPTAPTCELHIWPAARVAAVTQGAGSMFGLVGALIDAASNANRNKRDKAFITAALDPAAQARALRELNLPTLMSLPAASIITHDEGIDLKSDMTGRLSQSSAPCYYDVVVRQLFYLKTATTKGKMRTFIAVRGANGQTRVVDYKDSANHALDVKLPEEGEDATLASQALINAFKADVTQFSEKFVRKTTKS